MTRTDTYGRLALAPYLSYSILQFTRNTSELPSSGASGRPPDLGPPYTPFSPIWGLISDSDSQSYPPLEPQEDLQTVGHQLHHSVRFGDWVDAVRVCWSTVYNLDTYCWVNVVCGCGSRWGNMYTHSPSFRMLWMGRCIVLRNTQPVLEDAVCVCVCVCLQEVCVPACA
ncbi:unnamed protein product [Boreogadus saida]